MKECGCYDPGFILRMILGVQNGRAVHAWLGEQLKQSGSTPALPTPLSERDAVWMGDAEMPAALGDWVTISRSPAAHLAQLADLSLDVKGAQGYKNLLEHFFNLINQGVLIIQLKFAQPQSEAETSRVHLTVRLLRSVLMKMNSDVLLLTDNRDSGLDKSSFWGNTLNEAHLVYNNDWPLTFLHSIQQGQTGHMNQLVAGLKLPGLNVAYFNDIPAAYFEEPQVYALALSIGLALSGLPAINSLHSNVPLEQVAKLIQARRRSAVFQPASAQIAVEVDPRIFALMKISPDASQLALCLHNLINQPINMILDMESLGMPEGQWFDLISGQEFTLSGKTNLSLAAWSSVWLCQYGS